MWLGDTWLGDTWLADTWLADTWRGDTWRGEDLSPGSVYLRHRSLLGNEVDLRDCPPKLAS